MSEDYKTEKRRATKLRTWSEEDTKLPFAFNETMAQYQKIDPDTVIAFDFRLWVKSGSLNQVYSVVKKGTTRGRKPKTENT